MTFSQCVHGVYDEKMEAVYRKYSQNYSFKEDSESTYTIKGENMDNNQSNYENKNEFGQNPYPMYPYAQPVQGEYGFNPYMYAMPPQMYGKNDK